VCTGGCGPPSRWVRFPLIAQNLLDFKPLDTKYWVKFNVVYQITNRQNGKIYIGCHTTNDLEDGYLGSGSLMRKAVKKYGPENFSKEILFKFETIQEMLAKEAELVNEEFVSRKDTYNLTLGGEGSWFYVNANGLADQSSAGKIGGAKFAELLENNPPQKEEWKKSMDDGKARWIAENGQPFEGKKHKPETIDLMSKSSKGKGIGETNSQFGTSWIHSDGVSKKVKKEDLPIWFQKGWILGRKMPKILASTKSS